MAQRKTAVATEKAETKPERVNLFAEIGNTGLKRWGGFVSEEFHPHLKGRKAIEMWTEMRANSPIVGASELVIGSLLRGVTLRVKSGDDSNEGMRQRDLIETGFADMSSSWPDTLSEILTLLPFGWAWLEVVLKKRKGESRDPKMNSRFTDGLTGWRKWSLRGQSSLDKFDFDAEGGVQAMRQKSSAQGQRDAVIPIDKSGLFRTTTEKSNPMGRSILRPAYAPYYAAKRIMAIEGIGVERDLAGYPVMYVPVEYLSAAAGTAEGQILDYLKKMVVNIRRDEQEGALLPMVRDKDGNMMFEFKLMTSGGAQRIDTSKVIERYERRIAMAMVSDIVMLGHEKVGSFALADSKQDLLSVALGGWMDSVLGVINRHLIPRLLRANGWSAARPPVVERGDIHAPNLQELSQYISSLAGSGMLLFPSPDGELESALLSAAKLPTGGLGAGEVGKRNASILKMLMDSHDDQVEMMRELRELIRKAA